MSPNFSFGWIPLCAPAALALPAVVDVDVTVAVVDQPLLHDRLGRRPHALFAHERTKPSPRVAPHGRRQRERVADDQLQLAFGFSRRVLGTQLDLVCATLSDVPSDQSLPRIKVCAFRQPFGGKRHRPPPRYR